MSTYNGSFAYVILYFLLYQGKRTKRSGFKTFLTLQIEPTLKSLKLTPVGRLTTPSGLRGLGIGFLIQYCSRASDIKLLAH